MYISIALPLAAMNACKPVSEKPRVVMGMMVDTNLQPRAARKYAVWVVQNEGLLQTRTEMNTPYEFVTGSDGKFEVTIYAKKTANVYVGYTDKEPLSSNDYFCYFSSASYMQRMNAGIMIDRKN